MKDLNIRELSESFFELLPQDNEKFTLSDIETSGIPFLVRKRMIQIMNDRFRGSVQKPESEWADLNSPKAQKIWDDYLQQMADVLEIPAEKAQDIIHEATQFALHLAVRPRKTIVEVLFENQDTVTKDTLSEQLDQFVSNRHLVFALFRFMEKKQKDELGIDEAKQIIKKVDEKLSESYNSLDWMEAVKPIFNISGPAVASDLIRIFFEEKELHRVARKFDMMENELTETDFVEVMSSADLLNMSGFEEKQPALFTDEEEPMDEEATEPAESEEPADDEPEETEEEVRLGNHFLSSEVDSDISEPVDDSDIELNDPSEEEDEQEPYLLQLFREEDEIQLDEQEEESAHREESEENAEDDDEESESLSGDEPFETEEKRIDEPDEEDSGRSEKEMEFTSRKAADTGETEFEDEEEWEDVYDPEDAEIPRENQVFPEEKEDDDAEEVEEGSLLARFMETDQDADVDETDFQKPEEDEHSEPTSIYDELNLAPADAESDYREEITSAEEEDAEEDDDRLNLSVQDEMPFEPNDRLGDDSDENDSDEIDDTDSKISLSDEDEDEDLDDDIEAQGDEDDKEESDDAVPMWKSFLEREKPDDEPSFYFDDSSDENTDEEAPFHSDEDEINETPVINISSDASDIDDEIEHLSRWLAADHDRFLHEIFDDSTLAWEQALIDLTVFDDWKNASRYLENEIFNKNQIDIYSEVAVDFTDYLHSYFMKYKS